ncbi:hypothetical protein Tco_0915970, partial [Tanacetum coccineum]
TRLLYAKRNKGIYLGNVASKVDIEVQQLSLKDCTCSKEITPQSSFTHLAIPQARLPKKWLSFCQSLRNTNHVKDIELASLFANLNMKKTSLTDFQDSPDDEEDTRNSQEYLKDLKESKEEHESLFEVGVGAAEEGEVVCQVYKYEFWLQEVHFLKHVVNSNGIHVDPFKIEAVKN